MKVKCIRNETYTSELTMGKVYDVIGTNDRTYKVLDDSNNEYSFYKDRFEVMPDEKSLEEQLKEASQLFGKKVDVGSGQFDVTNITVYFKGMPHNGSYRDNEELLKNDFCVSVIGKNNSVPYKTVKLVNPSRTMKLNDDYTATVYKDKLEVGCQTFPISILDRLQELRKSL